MYRARAKRSGTTCIRNLARDQSRFSHIVSREYFEKERARIFSGVWLHVGRVEQIPGPGDYFVKELAICNTSILVVRGKDGVIRAFHNMCSHRNRNGLRCKLSHWHYATARVQSIAISLVVAREMARVRNGLLNSCWFADTVNSVPLPRIQTAGAGSIESNSGSIG